MNNLSILTVGALLYEIKESKAYKKYATHIKYFHEFIKEINMPYSRVKKYIDIWKYFGDILITVEDDYDIEQLIKVIPIIKKGGDVDEWVTKAITLTQQDFNNEIELIKGHRHSSICNHEHTKGWNKCSDCGAWIPKE